MKNILKYAFAGAILFGLASCEDDEQNVTDFVQETVERGAVLRTIDADDIGGSQDPTETIILGRTDQRFFLEFEEQDVLEGDLLDLVNVYVRYNDRSILNLDDEDETNDGADFSFPATPEDDILIATIPSTEFTDGPFGLPRATLDYTSDFFLSSFDVSTFDSTDQILVRLELVLTDGRIFSSDNAGGIITGGFFDSPFQYIVTIDSGINLNYLDNGLNAVVPQDDGVIAEYFIEAEVTDQIGGDNINTVNVYKRFVDTSPQNGDNSVPEAQVASFTGADFGTSEDGFPTFEIELLDGDLLGDLTVDDITLGDVFFIRYEVITNDGRTVTSDNVETQFYDRVLVTDCPVPPLTVTDTFVGDYNVEQITQSIFGYDTFDPDGGGVVLTLFSEVTDGGQVDPGIELAANRRSFDADYLAPLGFGNTRTYIMEFDNCSVTMIDPDGADGPLLGFGTGVLCNTLIYLGPQVGGGFFQEDDTTFDFQFFDDITDDCNGGGATPILRWTKL